jgi:lipoprotein-anchoring transpeptidase ErfK/SrfK
MHSKMRLGLLAFSVIAAASLLGAPAQAQWRYYNGDQADPPDNTYPPYPGGGQPDQNYGEPQAEPPNAYVPPDQRAYASPTQRVNPDSAPYNPPPNDEAAAASKRTRQEVEFPTREKPGTIIVDTASRHLYLVEGNGLALQYGIGVGREGFSWKGVAEVHSKQEWPKWFPPPEMLQRRPDLPEEMDGGLGNPLGARALYLWENGKDTLFRIHGTNEPDTIGHAVSSGCIRMMNGDVMDLYNRVSLGTKVVVL